MPSAMQPNLAEEDAETPLSIQFWILIILVGIGSGLGGAALMKLLRVVQYIAWPKVPGDFLDVVMKASPVQRVFVLGISGIVTMIGLLILRRMKDRASTDVSQAIWLHSGSLPLLKSFVSAVLSVVIVAMGAPLGREGAPKQVGTAIASRLASLIHLPLAQRRLLAACGAGAGIAAVYNVPLGGALFALEVLLGSLTLSRALPALATSAIAVEVARVYIPAGPTYMVNISSISISTILCGLILGPIAGCASTFYVRSIIWAEGEKPEGWIGTLSPLLAFITVGIFAIFYPQILGNGKDVVQGVFASMMSIPLLCTLLILRPLATSICLASGAPGGLFTPTMTFGAILGDLFGHIWNAFWPGVWTANYAVIGSGAVLAAATLGPVSAVVLLLELTHCMNEIAVPLILAVAGAMLTTRALKGRSIYAMR